MFQHFRKITGKQGQTISVADLRGTSDYLQEAQFQMYIHTLAFPKPQNSLTRTAHGNSVNQSFGLRYLLCEHAGQCPCTTHLLEICEGFWQIFHLLPHVWGPWHGFFSPVVDFSESAVDMQCYIPNFSFYYFFFLFPFRSEDFYVQ